MEELSTVKLLWGLLWRTSLSGLVFGAILVAVFGAALPNPSGPGHLGLRGALFGTVAGAVEGSALGTLCGLMLFATTWAFYFPMPTNARDYLTTAGATCALAGLALMLADWLLHGCPDPNALALWRTLNMITPGETAWPPNTGILTFGSGPLLVAVLDMWLSGTGAARWYAHEAQRPLNNTSSEESRPYI